MMRAGFAPGEVLEMTAVADDTYIYADALSRSMGLRSEEPSRPHRQTPARTGARILSGAVVELAAAADELILDWRARRGG